MADRYFTAIDGGKAPFGPDCNRVQNGTQTTNNPSFQIPGMTWNPFSLGCQAQIYTSFFSFVDNVRPRRFAVVDRERGLVFGLFMFHVSGTVTSYTPGVRRCRRCRRPVASTVAVASSTRSRRADRPNRDATGERPLWTPTGHADRMAVGAPSVPVTPGRAAGPATRSEGHVDRYLRRWWPTIRRACSDARRGVRENDAAAAGRGM